MVNLLNIPTLVNFVKENKNIIEISNNKIFCNCCNKQLSYFINQGIKTIKLILKAKSMLNVPS